MGWLRTMGKRVALRVSAVVARNELFERYGERPVQPPLTPGTWVAPSSENESDEDDQEPDCRPTTLKEFRTALEQGPAIYHHWATWCEACVEEMPMVRRLIKESPLPVVGVSWDAFEAENAQACLGDVAIVAKEMGFDAPQLVLDVSPDQLFESMKMEFQQVPQTWLVSADGEILCSVDGELDATALTSLVAEAGSLQ